MHLYEALSLKVADWRNRKYAHEQFPAIGETLEWAANPDVSSFRLRTPQLRALDVYWYLLGPTGRIGREQDGGPTFFSKETVKRHCHDKVYSKAVLDCTLYRPRFGHNGN